jgi:hypothetical protein
MDRWTPPWTKSLPTSSGYRPGYPGITEHGFTFNQFLLTGDEPFLFHCGQRQLFPLAQTIDPTGRLLI